MKRIFTLFSIAILTCSTAKSQVVMNELYSDPGSGNHEFFELYNTSPTGAIGTNNLTMVCFFDNGSSKGFFVMDLPNLSIPARGFFVGSSASPFNYQGTTGSTQTDFNWNSAAFTSNGGYVRMWQQGGLNVLDGNLNYDMVALPPSFNNFLFRRTGAGSSYSVFLYRDGTLINTFLGGTGGAASILGAITSMPSLFVDMTGTSPDFTINFSTYGSLPIENCTQDAGSDNGYIREFDGACGSWTKSSAQVQHTPRASNGSIANTDNSQVVISAAVSRGTAATGSILNSNIVSAPASYFPIQLQVFTDLGTSTGTLDANDVYVTTNTENTVSDGPFFNTFFPFDAHILIAAKTNAGCFDRVMYLQNTMILTAEHMNFTGAYNNNNISLSWTLEQNEHVDRFELQQSSDGQNFNSIAQIISTENRGHETYSYNAPLPVNGKVFYRLRIFNKNSTVEYSKTISFDSKINSNNTLVLLNNPATDKVVFNFQASGNQPVAVRIIDMSGRIVQQNTVTIQKGINLIQLPFNSSVRMGSYVVDLQEGNQHYTSKFIKQ